MAIHTNEFGKRVESSWYISEKDAAFYKDAEKIAGTEEIRTPTGSTSDFREIAAEFRAGKLRIN